MSTFAALPLILVSAKSEEAANHFISQLIDNEPPEAAGGGRVWRIDNKYYRCDVRLQALPDGAPPPDPDTVEGHVIYLAEDECTEEAGARRAAAGEAARVRLLAAEAGALTARLEAWAARRRLEPVPLRAPRGLDEARAALQAHVWPGLTRHAESGGNAQGASADDEEAEEWDAAQWGAALGAVEGVRALRGEERLAAAERLVAAFCRALGEEL